MNIFHNSLWQTSDSPPKKKLIVKILSKQRLCKSLGYASTHKIVRKKKIKIFQTY